MGCASSIEAAQPPSQELTQKDGDHLSGRPLLGCLHRVLGQQGGRARGTNLSALPIAKGEAGGTSANILDPEWELKALNIAATTMPFVPSRVSLAFVSGQLTETPWMNKDADKSSAGTNRAVGVVRLPIPRVVQAAVLLVDVSGFTALSEDARRRLGSEGVESFSLAMSAFFTIMLELISAFHGDVDCFAGDAVVVLFEPRDDDDSQQHDTMPGQPDGGPPATTGLNGAVRRALSCAKAVHTRLDGFRNEPEDPPLGMHSALAAGELTCVECGGVLANRSEAFVIGPALSEIGEALGQTARTQIILAPSAMRVWAGDADVSWSHSALSDGSLLLTPEIHHSAASDSENEPSESTKSLPFEVAGAPEGPKEGEYTNSLCPPETVVAQMHSIDSFRPYDKPGVSSMIPTFSSSSEQAEGVTLMQLFEVDSSGSSRSGAVFLSHPANDYGIGALLRFMPAVAQKGCLSQLGTASLMEHRLVTILFIIADMKEHEARYSDGLFLQSLQSTLGSSIDVVQVHFGGETRQITVDDKGLAMIFIFGLPGYRSSKQTVPAIVAGQKVLSLLGEAGISGTAGVTTDYVNTGARMAVAAAQQGVGMLCSQEVQQATQQAQLDHHNLTLQPAGSIKLKGKSGEARVFSPESSTEAAVAGRKSPAEIPAIIGRDDEMELLHLAVSGGRTGGPGVTMVLIEGAQGLGKSTLVKTLMGRALQRPSAAESSTEWVLIRASEEDSTPLMTCQTILRWILDLSGEPDAERMSWLLGDFELGPKLPAILRPHAEALETLRRGQADKTAALVGLYASIIYEALRDTSVALVIEDIHNLDRSSLAVIERIAGQLETVVGQPADCLPPGGHSRGQQGSAIICTSVAPGLLPRIITADLKSLRHGQSAAVFSLKLEPLEAEVLVEIGRVAQGWESVPGPVASMVADRAEGVPLHAVELFEWLRREEYVGKDGQLTPKADDTVLKELVPPSIQSMVLAQVDQLPAALGAVLRCACILGSPFTTEALFHLLPKGLTSREEELEEMLDMLLDQNLIEPTVVQLRTRSSHTLAAEQSWRICSTHYQQVLYKTMAHKYRRALHRKATDMYERMVSADISFMQARPLLRALTHHLQKAVVIRRMTGDTATPSNSKVSEVVLVADALQRAATNSQVVGDFRESYDYRTKQLAILKEQNEACSHQVLKLLEAEQEASDEFHRCMMSALLWDPEFHAAISSLSGEQEHEEYLRHQTEIQERIDALARSPVASRTLALSSSKRQKKKKKKKTTIPITRRLAIMKLLSSLAVDFISSNGFLKQQGISTLYREVHKPGRDTLEKVYWVVHMAMAGFNSASCWTCLERGDTFNDCFGQAGRPHDLTDMVGTPVSCGGSVVWLIGQIGTGDIDGSAVPFAQETIDAVDNNDGGYVLSWWECIEAAWEPLASRRVMTLRDNRKALGKITNPRARLAHCMDSLYNANTAAEKIRPFLTGDVQAQDDSVQPSKMCISAFNDSLAKAVKAAQFAAAGAQHFGQAAVVRHCIAEGCRILFLETWTDEPTTPATIPVPALECLASVCTHLSAMLEAWGKTSLNIFGGQSLLPSVAILGRSMLHLFQWVLLQAGHSRQAPVPVHLPTGVYGLSDPGPVALQPGPGAVVSGLLVAQRVAAVRGEVTFGLLPATVALARLLLGQGCCQLLQSSCRGVHVYVPESPPVPMPPGASPEAEDFEPISVVRVCLGSPEAWRLAAVHLTGAVQAITVQGRRVSLASVTGPGDVGGSESLWEAAQVCRRVVAQLDGRPQR